MLTILVSADCGKSVLKAKLLSVEALEIVLGEVLFQGMTKSNIRQEEMSWGNGTATEAVTVRDAEQGPDYMVTIMLYYEMGRQVADNFL